MASSVWKGSISFGLVSIPVRLYTAARPHRTNLHEVHALCHTRLRHPLFCPKCKRIVERSEVIRAFEGADGRLVLLEPDEIKKIEPRSSHAMEILSFVDSSQVDPVFFETSYFLTPENGGEKGYRLLFQSLERSNRLGIVKLAMHLREHTAFIRPYENGLALHTMYFPDEIRKAPGYGTASRIKLSSQEVALANQLVEALSGDFKPQQYHDEFQDRLRSLVEAKQKGRHPTVVQPPRRAPVIDIMTALKRSLASSEARRRAGAPSKPRRTKRQERAAS